jgi:hypothetical protein
MCKRGAVRNPAVSIHRPLNQPAFRTSNTGNLCRHVRFLNAGIVDLRNLFRQIGFHAVTSAGNRLWIGAYLLPSSRKFAFPGLVK